MDGTAAKQQEALGVFGVNLLYGGAFQPRGGGFFWAASGKGWG